MRMPTRQLLGNIVTLALIISALFYVFPSRSSESPFGSAQNATSTQAAASAAASSTGPVSPAAATSSAPKLKAPTPEKSSIKATESGATSSEPAAKRVENPYPTPPESFDAINTAAREALVNIYCLPRGGGLRPISGSGIIIDPRGIVLTNAHVAQYVLLSQSPRIDLACFLRGGSPAAVRWIPSVMYMPPVWVAEHASEITAVRPVGTGEHDYALLYIAASSNGSARPGSFPAVLPDTRPNIGFVDDQVLVASYPAEFLGNVSTDLHAAASVTTIGELFTFGTTSVDAISVGGVIEAQSGSSGGAIVNAWRRLIGIITTTSSGATTAERDLRAITLDYINRDLIAQTGRNLSEILAEDPAAQTRRFAETAAAGLAEQLIAQLTR